MTTSEDSEPKSTYISITLGLASEPILALGLLKCKLEPGKVSEVLGKLTVFWDLVIIASEKW